MVRIFVFFLFFNYFKVHIIDLTFLIILLYGGYCDMEDKQ